MMISLRATKILLICVWVSGIFLWWVSTSKSKSNLSSQIKKTLFVASADEYVGSESCQVCHKQEFDSFSETKHAKLKDLPKWKDKMQGCESCHGPGKAHIEADGDITKIIAFSKKSPKEISESCLICHTGKEERHNFRRGEHWRNDVSCADCHSPHNTHVAATKGKSTTFVEQTSKLKRDTSTLYMLRTSEPQLCLKCHAEMKAQFAKPFHHRVLEGTIKCSDCHNQHGGFETKQSRLAFGTDAACVKCHTDKQGPFTFEHATVKIEGCMSCHAPHGASNSKLLIRNQVNQLCLECHSNIMSAGVSNVSDSHNLATLRYQNCTVCHAAIHGSHTNRYFLR